MNIECNFEPSCSEYTYQSIDKYGIFLGVKMGFKRISRCKDANRIEKIEDPVR